MHDALLLDIGYVIIDLSWPAVEAYEAATGRAVPGGTGFEPESDTHWQAHRAGALGGDEYWDLVARSRGMDGGFLELFRGMAEVVPDALFDRAALALMRDTRASGRKLGTLTNDAYTFIGKPFFAGRPEFADLDAFVDASDIGVRKPDPEAYLVAAKALGVPPEGVVFLDDKLECVEGARQVGMVGIQVDPFDRGPAFAQARELLGLPTG